MGDEEDEEESDAVVNQVLDELGLQLGDQLTDVPGTGATLTAPAAKGKVPVAAGADVSCLWQAGLILKFSSSIVCTFLKPFGLS